MAGQALADFALPEKSDSQSLLHQSRRCFRCEVSGVDPILSPEMHSTGEVMGVGETFGEAYGKAMTAAGLSAAASGPSVH